MKTIMNISKYRADIDGLRALAIILVVLYHSKLRINGIEVFKAGLIGVDIFFVISGYLITKILVNEYYNHKKINFLNFYERRIRRILPQLILVSVFSIFFAYFFFSPAIIVDLADTILSSLLFYSNYFFYFHLNEYASPKSQLIPFLHTWSLSVEEQFYIFYPLLILFLFKFFKNDLFKKIIYLSVLFFGISVFSTIENANFSFFSFTSRIWEFLVGGIIFFQEKRNFKKKAILYYLGFLLILFSLITYHLLYKFHPSIWTLFPVLGVYLLILHYDKKILISTIFVNKVSVFIGLISYSIYIWHYPIFSFTRILNVSDGNMTKKIIGIISVIFLSIVSYFFFEKPLRNKKLSFMNFFKIISASLGLLFIIVFYSFSTNGFEDRVKDKKLFSMISSFDELGAVKRLFKKCDTTRITNENFCQYGNGKKKLLLVGDSHILPLVRDLKSRIITENYNLKLLYSQGNLLFRYDENDKRANYLRKQKDSVIVIGGYIHRESKQKINYLKKKYFNLISDLSKNNNLVIVIYPVPEIDLLLNKKKFNSIDFFEKNLEDEFIPKKKFIIRSSNAYKMYDSIPYIKRIYPEKMMCDLKRCYSVLDNNIYKSDIDHASLFLAKKINEQIVTYLKNDDNK